MAEVSIKSVINYMIDWIQARVNERTTWDGLTIMVISFLALIASPFIRYIAWLGLIYGAWTLWKKDKKN
jgi:hypothetical protein